MASIKVFPLLHPSHPEFLSAFKNGENLQEFYDNWIKDESKFKERFEWNRRHELEIEKEWEKMNGKSKELTIQKALNLNKNL